MKGAAMPIRTSHENVFVLNCVRIDIEDLFGDDRETEEVPGFVLYIGIVGAIFDGVI